MLQPMRECIASLLGFLRAEASGWRSGEVAWLVFSAASIVSLSIFWGESVLGTVAAVTGVAYTVFAGKGKRSCFLFGLVNTPLYAWISWRNGYYGDMALNIYYFSMMVPGLMAWSRHMSGDDKGGIVRSRLSRREALFWMLALAAACLTLYAILVYFGGARPACDAVTNVLSVAGMIFTLRRLSAQWLMWIAVDAVEIFMWLGVWLEKGAQLSILLMWILFLLNGIYLWRVWLRSTSVFCRPEKSSLLV